MEIHVFVISPRVSGAEILVVAGLSATVPAQSTNPHNRLRHINVLEDTLMHTEGLGRGHLLCLITVFTGLPLDSRLALDRERPWT